MNLFRKEISSVLLSAAVLGSLCTSCWDDNESETIINDLHNALITSVTLGANANVCSALSNYTFTVDHLGTSDPELIERTRALWEHNETDVNNLPLYSTLQPGILFNPDSLPLGSIPDSIKVNLSYSSPYKVEIFQYDEDLAIKHYTNYADTQTVWFDDYALTRIEITARDTYTKKSYFMKVNVHQVKADTVSWRYLAKNLFDASDVQSQRVDTLGQTLYWYTQTSDNSQQVRTADLTGDVREWSEAQAVASPATINLNTMLNWRQQLYAVGADHSLLTTTDGVQWTTASSARTFVNVLGAQLTSKTSGKEHLCAIVEQEGAYHFARTENGTDWKLDTLTVEDQLTSQVPASFPIYDYCRPLSVAARPSLGNDASRLCIISGMKADSTLTSSVWMCDGKQWAEFEQGFLPASQGASVIRYTLDVKHPDSFWILHPGVKEGGVVSDTLFYSENYGLSWRVLMRDYLRYGDTYEVAPFGRSSAFYNPNDYRMYFIGGRNRKGEEESNIVTGQLVKLATKQKL